MLRIMTKRSVIMIIIEHRPNTYSKANLCQILIFWGKAHLADKYTHNKFLAFAVQCPSIHFKNKETHSIQ